MRLILYFLVYSCLLIALFLTFMFLMILLDPGLMRLAEKATRMIRTDRQNEMLRNTVLF